MARTPSSQPSGRQQVRIIGGKWRSRRLSFPSAPGLRPTGDRIRETLFNWLAGEVSGARCVDAFAGSGALGFEALSRGAGSVTFIDSAREVCAALSENCRLLGATGTRVVRDDFLHWLGTAPPSAIDIIFIDPPFTEDLQAPALDTLLTSRVLAPAALVYLESPADSAYRFAGWRLLKEKTAGTVCYRLMTPD